MNKKEIHKYIKKENIIIFDIGCYDGKDSLEFAYIFPQSLIYSFEIDSRSIKLFNKNIKHSRINLVEIAISNVDGYVSWNPSNSKTRRHSDEDYWSASSSIKSPKEHLNIFQDVYFENKTVVKSTRLDTWTKQNNIYPDIMWVDLNGAEKEFILGAKNTLKTTSVIIIEFDEKKLYDGSLTKQETLQMLPNFELKGIYNFEGNFGNLFLINGNLKNG